MDTLNRELTELLDEVAPPLIDLEQLERLVTEDDLIQFDGECLLHDGCRPIGR
ncbi:hypothetical protein M2152_001281 [Microbacteriaceae bacterium SG_E_30_P1]|uniref:Uncharacterized protein n=1 Tax=Antiquaquibacter oligotrophicus TaxID=2880260 RepID=A0ABT6KMM0_9MICO|nr:hypothetical protein [Antiquaquibacter oligotrophicus]MDH6181099.1 hypothetical protein [Antiquaquibacter oligotrophicus]UDF13203.1 hypothetical protein LH407_13745 [Antiquaquibacter oligotrophicus]